MKKAMKIRIQVHISQKIDTIVWGIENIFPSFDLIFVNFHMKPELYPRGYTYDETIFDKHKFQFQQKGEKKEQEFLLQHFSYI